MKKLYLILLLILSKNIVSQERQIFVNNKSNSELEIGFKAPYLSADGKKQPASWGNWYPQKIKAKETNKKIELKELNAPHKTFFNEATEFYVVGEDPSCAHKTINTRDDEVTVYDCDTDIVNSIAPNGKYDVSLVNKKFKITLQK